MRGIMVAAASLSVLILGAQIVRADQCTTTTIRQSTTVPAIMPLEPVVPDARASLMYSRSSSPTTYSTVKVRQFGGPENYAGRLARMQEQIDLGFQRGLITALEANRLKLKYSDLCQTESQVRALGFPKMESDALEKGMNIFNVEISNSLSNGARTSRVGVYQ